MSSSFAELMKVAQQNTQSSNREAIEAAKRREAALRQAREEQAKKERAEREIQKQLQLRKLEDARKEEERKKQREEELAKKREDLARKKEVEAEQAKYAVAGSSRDGSKAKSSNPYIVTNSSAMTREEKRMAKDPLMADKLKASRQAATRKRKDGRLPGGAVADSSASPSKSGSGTHISARMRIAAGFAPTLTRLNTEKRDTRTIDEITRDLKKGRIGGQEKETVISGEKAQAFNDWFGKKDKSKAVDPTDSKKKAAVASREPPKFTASGASATRPALGARPYSSNSAAGSSSSLKLAPKKPPGAAPSAVRSSKAPPAPLPISRKRTREESYSDEDSFIEDDVDEDSEEERRYAKRPNGLGETQRDMIWKLMGRDRSRYAGMDLDSDDDMEVTRADLEREERQSSRIAKREDAEAEEQERLRELEKKRRKGMAKNT